jgi:uroporphyrinogen decarboxylase
MLAADRESVRGPIDQKIRFWHGLGFDCFWQAPLVNLVNMITLASEDTAINPRAARGWVDENEGAITSWKDFESYPWPRPEDTDYYPLEYAAENLPEGMALAASTGGVLEPVMWLMGYQTFAIALYDQPDLVRAMFEKVEELVVSAARSLAQCDRVIALWMGDDMGYKTGTMIAPVHMREYVFPIQKQVAGAAHDAGMPFILHSCGNLEEVMDDLIDDVGVDAMHSFEDAIEPVESWCDRYAERVAVVGGVDVDLLTRGSEEQVRARTRQVLEACGPSGAYVLGSGNSVANYIPPHNFLTMVDEGWRYRTGMAG